MIAVLQARTNSSRLPAKVLLPIKGIPLSVLAAKRAANTGIDIIVVTSEEKSDDELAKTINEYGLKCFRGSLNNTLQRIVDSLDTYDDQTIVFRLTADNVFPDGALLEEVVNEMLSENLEYICCNGMQSGLPYGLSVEATYLKHLRNASKTTKSAFDQEHVTPFIIQKFGEHYFDKYQEMKKGHYRCTVDCLDDYLMILKVFNDVSEPYKIPFLSLVSKLEGLTYQPKFSKPATKMILGTAQLGLDYGITNIHGKPDVTESTKILKESISNGVRGIDTARAYGNSEAIIGMSLKGSWKDRTQIITKLSSLQQCPKDASSEVVCSFVDASVYQSCIALQSLNLDVLLLHRASHIDDWNCAVWHRLLELKAEGVIKRLGVSIQNSYELKHSLDNLDVEYIQMPYNILDWRWDNIISSIKEIKKQRSLTVHIRSALLQGLLLSEDLELWKRAHISNAEKIISWLDAQSNKYKMSKAELCLKFVSSLDWVDGVVIGVENLNQLNENLKVMSDSRNFINESILLDSRPLIEEKALNPANWSSTK